MLKKIFCFFLFLLCGCTNLSRQEEINIRYLESQGVTIEKPAGSFVCPANPVAAGALNILPGGGNFYLANGNGADSSHWLYGGLNLITWPFSVLWGVPEAAIDANRINKREMIYYYQFDPQGSQELKKEGKKLMQ